MYLAKRVELYKKKSSNIFDWFTIPEIIADTFNVRVSIGVADKKDQFSFQLDNSYGKYASKFEVGDNIKIYFGQNKSPSSLTIVDDLAIDGIINSVPEEVSDSGKVLTISGTSRTEFLLSALVLIDQQAKTPPELAEKIIGEVNRTLQIGGSYLKLNFLPLTDTFTDESTQNPSKRSDGTSHDTFQLAEIYKQAYLLLERVASKTFTKDIKGNYIYWLDNQNNFHFRYKSSNVAAIITEGSTTGLNAIKIDKKTDNIINALITNCGADPNGAGIHVPVFDYASMQRFGAKWKYVTTTSNIAHDLMQTERDKQASSFTSTDGFVPTSFPYTTYWQSSVTDTDNAPNVTAGNTVTCTSKGQYVDAVRREAKARGRFEGEKILHLFANPRIKATVEFQRTTAYSTADFITINVPSYNITNKNLRLKEIQHDDYKTELTLEEDETTILTA